MENQQPSPTSNIDSAIQSERSQFFAINSSSIGLGIFFIVMLILTGIFGYYLGRTNASKEFQSVQQAIVPVPTVVPTADDRKKTASSEIVTATPTPQMNSAPVVVQTVGQTVQTISTGIYGIVEGTTGACLLPTTSSANGCRRGPAQVEIVVTKPNLPGADEYFENVKLAPAEILYTTVSNDKGFFQFELPPGEYRYFVKTNNRVSCPEGGSDPCHVVLGQNQQKKTELKIVFDNSPVGQ